MKCLQIKRIHHIQICIPTGEENKARQFYSQILGLEEIEKPDALKANGGLWFTVADIELHIGTETHSGISKRHPAFEVENLDIIKKHFIEQNVSIKEETQIPGMKRFSFYDPFQNRIEFVELTSV
ncbi:VOC family protein [Pseudalkalibacillus berkeleyi]|uniref:VOC family protein n=1 Tax=Pseudalkalibacillus berkeleyi TaxID=1069813 RepID=A0ABS9GZT3_9BACL|nr:VOC family protein [Pseudalkalibacillus berkeleyi]MCF6136915.1 VOC family protein [Pseudalkalibacillus berkeleyi]